MRLTYLQVGVEHDVVLADAQRQRGAQPDGVVVDGRDLDIALLVEQIQRSQRWSVWLDGTTVSLRAQVVATLDGSF